MGQIYLPILGVGPVEVPGHEYKALGQVDGIPLAIRVLASLHNIPASGAIREAHRSRNAIGKHVAFESEGRLSHYTMYVPLDSVEDVFTQAHEETHVANELGILQLVNQRGRAFRLKKDLCELTDPEFQADVGGVVGLFIQGIDALAYLRNMPSAKRDALLLPAERVERLVTCFEK
jgi:hypothetical protein